MSDNTLATFIIGVTPDGKFLKWNADRIRVTQQEDGKFVVEEFFDSGLHGVEFHTCAHLTMFEVSSTGKGRLVKMEDVAPDEVNLDGVVDTTNDGKDGRPYIKYIGTAVRQENGLYRVTAQVNESLCTVEVKLSKMA